MSVKIPLYVTKMLFFSLLIFCIFSLISVNANGELSILHHPKSLVFKGHDLVRESTVKEIYSAALGLSNTQYSNWRGMYIIDPFYMPEGVATISVEGVPSIDQVKGHHFPLRTDMEAENLFNILRDRITGKDHDFEPQIVHVDLENGLNDLSQNSLFDGIKNDKPEKSSNLYLNDNSEGREVLKELQLLNLIADKIASDVKTDGVPDLFWFKVSSLHPLVDLYGDNSTEVKAAKQMLNEAILYLNAAFKEAYNGAVLVSVITSDASHTRRTRSIQGNTNDRDLNLASDYSEDFPVIFNIILWLCVILGFSLFAVSLVIGNMDPGRDSIIYRMTNPRMKKDN